MDEVDSSISEADQLILEQQKAGAFPIKKSVVITVIAFWNIAAISGLIKSFDHSSFPFGIGTMTALLSLLVQSIITLISKRFSKLILKQGKSIHDISKFLYFLIILCTFMLLVASIRLNEK